MAQSKTFFGLRRGSTKSLTFSVYGGKQVTKDRLTEVKNPRSNLQMVQRAYMATAMRGYSALKEICDHSFENIPYGQKSMNYFVSLNSNILRKVAPNVNLSLYKGYSISNTYVIAKGSLPMQTIEVKDFEGVKRFAKSLDYVPSSIDFSFFMEIFGASEIGDMVTFVHLVSNTDANASLYWVRFKMTNENKTKTLDLATFPANILNSLSRGADYETNINNFSPTDFPFNIEDSGAHSKLTIGKSTATDNRMHQSMGVILSRKSGDGWLRSSSTMVNLTETFNYNKVLSSYPTAGEVILNGGNV